MQEPVTTVTSKAPLQNGEVLTVVHVCTPAHAPLLATPVLRADLCEAQRQVLSQLMNEVETLFMKTLNCVRDNLLHRGFGDPAAEAIASAVGEEIMENFWEFRSVLGRAKISLLPKAG